MPADDELAFLRGIAANPYDRARLCGYSDWLEEAGRGDEAAVVRGHAMAAGPAVSGNSITVGELVGHLLTMPLDVVVLYRAFSDWLTLTADEVTLHKAEDRQICYRPESGYMGYYTQWWANNPAGGENNPREGETPNFVTVCCFPGN